MGCVVSSQISDELGLKPKVSLHVRGKCWGDLAETPTHIVPSGFLLRILEDDFSFIELY